MTNPLSLVGNLLGGGIGSAVEKIAGAFTPNAEREAVRQSGERAAALGQFAAEFQERANRTWLDSLADALNRLPRPLCALGVLGLFVATPIWPAEMAAAFASWALIPVELWGIFGVIISFYFAGRMQVKSHAHRKNLEKASADFAALAARRAPESPPVPLDDEADDDIIWASERARAVRQSG